MTPKEYIQAHNIKFEWTKVYENPYMDGPQLAFNYQVKIKHEKREFTTIYSKGSGHVRKNTNWPIPPSLPEVLECMSMDISVLDYDLEEWCDNLGYDPDSKRDTRIYELCKDSAERLRATLSADAWEQLYNGEVEW